MRFRDWWGCIAGWLSVRDAAARNSREISYLDKKITRLADQYNQSVVALARCEVRLDKLQRGVDAEILRAKSLLEESNRLNGKLNEALDGARDRLKTLEELTVPGLVASHQLLIKRAEADTAVQAARTVFAHPQRELE